MVQGQVLWAIYTREHLSIVGNRINLAVCLMSLELRTLVVNY